jgi:hypothetical protein
MTNDGDQNLRWHTMSVTALQPGISVTFDYGPDTQEDTYPVLALLHTTATLVAAGDARCPTCGRLVDRGGRHMPRDRWLDARCARTCGISAPAFRAPIGANVVTIIGLIELVLRDTPALPGAACRTRSELFDADTDEQAAQAILVCQTACPALARCEAWAASLPDNSFDGVVGGRRYVWTQQKMRRPASPRKAENLVLPSSPPVAS